MGLFIQIFYIFLVCENSSLLLHPFSVSKKERKKETDMVLTFTYQPK